MMIDVGRILKFSEIKLFGEFLRDFQNFYK